MQNAETSAILHSDFLILQWIHDMAVIAEQGNRPFTQVSLPHAPAPAPAPRRGLWWPLHPLALRYPFAVFLLLVLGSNVAGSVFSVAYNAGFIQVRYMDQAQTDAFQNIAIPLYNVVAYPISFGLAIYLLYPLHRCLCCIRRGKPVAPTMMEQCRRRLVNLPWLQVRINFAGWMPGAIVFPLIVCAVGGTHEWLPIWLLFALSFVISAVFTTAQTFFIIEDFLVAYLYPEFFRDSRPEKVTGARLIPFRRRLWMLWLAIAWMPLVSLFVVMLSPTSPAAMGLLFAVSTVSSAVIFNLVGRDLLHWLNLHAAATGEIAHSNFAVRIEEQRPDEWGRLTNHFNDMAAALGRAEELRDTFGQFVGPDVRDEIMGRFHGLEAAVEEVTVMFADIRGFTRRSAGEPPERVGVLLNRFLTLALRAVEEKGGLVNKFLGDGFMALFGAARKREDHADLALASARDLLHRLRGLNEELIRQGQAPLVVGIGIHTGPALVGCFGATREGRTPMRREFTAIGETVNFCQRLEQLTKTCGGPILLSEQTHRHLCRPAGLEYLGPHSVPGAPEPLVVHRAGEL
jgi:adenylate cyclase